MAKPLTFWEHIYELRRRLIRIIATVGVLMVVLFSIGIRHTVVNGVKIYYVWPDVFHNLPAQMLIKAKRDLVPGYVQLIVTAPGEAIFAEITLSIFLAVLFGMPMIVYQIMSFVSPGLYAHEKRLVRKIILPSSLLFIAGASFAYIVILPFAFNFLYLYATALGAATFITINDFITFTVMFLIGLGASFQLPLIMYGVSYLGVVKPKFWLDHWRIAFVIITVFSAIITPDSSGVTMWFVVIPMTVLYFAGYFFSARHGHKEAAIFG